MPQIQQTKKLPYTPQQMFDLVADVARYPEFLPWCSAAQLIERQHDYLIGRITAQKGLFRQSFTTKNHFVYPERMSMVLMDGPFSHLNAQWRFEALPDGCRVHYEMDLGVPFFLKGILEGLAQNMASTMVDAFCKRAEALYG